MRPHPVALANAENQMNRPDWLSESHRRLAHARKNNRELDLFSGIAGVIYAHCLLEPVHAAVSCQELVDRLLDAAEFSEGFPLWHATGRLDKKTDRYFGVAHGCAGILLALGKWAAIAKDADLTEFVQNSFRLLIRKGMKRKVDFEFLPMSAEKSHRPTSWGGWCHGPSGVVWAILVGFGDAPELLHELDYLVNRIFSEPIRIENPTLCHGLAGQLDLARVLASIDRYSVQANARIPQLLELIWMLRTETEKELSWSSEEPIQTTPDFWVGSSGTFAAILKANHRQLPISRTQAPQYDPFLPELSRIQVSSNRVGSSPTFSGA